jgi:hypothetical protein
MLTLITATLAACTLNGGSANLTFQNTSWRSIPLSIPGVMNPNLNPRSTSGVTLRDGQEVFFTYRGGRKLLLTICNERNGDVIVVNDVIARRTLELDAQRR